VALALYRKYRPRTFAEVIGQEHVTEPLSQALRSGRLHHAYLFSGPRGCGKTSSARILARSLNCEQGPTPEPCGKCDSCIALAPDGSGSIDVIEIDAASHGGVDDARDLRERAFFAPVASRFKVYVIDEAHMVSSAGFNALLKLVEEPPDYVKFVFATTEPEKVLGTIKSRTHHYPFRLIPPGVLRPYLEQLTNAEGVKVEPAVFPLVVRAGGGSARDTLSVLDQLIAGAGPEGVSYARAVALLGVTDVALIDEMCDALAASDGAGAYAVIDRVVEAGHDPRRFAADLLERLRDLIILQQVPDAVTKGLLDAPEDQLERMAAQASHLGMATLSRFADIVHNGLTEMRGTTAPRLLLELICARMLLPGVDDATGALLQRLERMERRLAAGSDTTAMAAPVPEASPTSVDVGATAGAAAEVSPGTALAEDAAPEPAAVEYSTSVAPPAPATSAPGALDAVAVRRVWDEVLTIVSRKSKRAAAVVREATVRDVEGDSLVLVFKHSVHADMLSKSPEILVEALYELLGGRWQLRCEVGGAGSSPAGSSRLQSPPARPPTEPPTPRSATSAAKISQPAATEEWPTPAQVGGRAGDDQSEDWPTPAQPAGYLPDLSTDQAPGTGAPGSVAGSPASAIASGSISGETGLAGGSAGRPGLGAGSGSSTGGLGSGSGGLAGPSGSGGAIATQAVATQAVATQAARSGAARAVAAQGAATAAGAVQSGAAHAAVQPGAAHAAVQPGAAQSGAAQAAAQPAAAHAATRSGVAQAADEPGAGQAAARPRAAQAAVQPGAAQAAARSGAAHAATQSSAAQAAAQAAAAQSGAAQAAAVPAATPAPRRSAAVEQARAAASRAGSGQRSGAGQRGSSQRGPNQRSGGGQRSGGPGSGADRSRRGPGSGGSAWDGTTGEEPPYDPEYDGPNTGDPQYPGFDPGDEPLDDADPAASRESTEEAALRLLSEALGAEKIGETGG